MVYSLHIHIFYIILFFPGYLNQFLQLSQYTWLGIISYYIWKTCKDNNYSSSYFKYAIIGYSLPLVMTAISYLAQNLEINEDLKPGISNSRCGLNGNVCI